MLTAKSLERIIELEDNLKAEYQVQLDAKTTALETKTAELETATKDKEEQKAVIAKQLEQIQTLTTEAAGNKKVEQQNRELHQRCENLQEDVATLKKRMKGLQKDLAEERAELSTLKQFDPAKMKKNLDANKKKLAEKTTANDLLQKSLNKTKAESAEQQRTIKELEAKLAELEPAEEVEEAAA
jgi:chromosome segregation ATPase